jgi:copper chaperone NosL
MVKEFTLMWFVFLIVWPPGLIAGEDRGRPTCDYCRMIITEKEYGGRIKTVKGKTLIFDATECMAAYVIKAMVKPAEIQSLWSMHFNQPGRMVNAKTACYLQSNSMMSPMSINLSAYASRAEAERMRENHPGEILNWTQVLDHVKQKWFREMLGGPRR